MKRPVWSGVFLLSIAIALAPAAAAQTTGACHATDVPGPIVLPDDTVEESGRLEICLSSMYSPVAGLLRAAINGQVSGMFVSRKEVAATATDDQRPRITFAHMADGTYKLESYAVSDGERMVTFRMRPERVRSRWQVRAALVSGIGL
jgi:hypothetical protein